MAIKLDYQSHQLSIEKNAQSVCFHPLWLRERSQEADVFDADSNQRLYDPETIIPPLLFEAVDKVDEQHISILFSDKHRATYCINELFAEVNKHSVLPEKVLWKSDEVKIHWFNFDENQDEQQQLFEILDYYHRYGFVIVGNLPAKAGEIVRFAERIGCVRETNFGKTFDVVSVKKPIDLAYTSRALGAHTDNPYRAQVPGVQFLFCIENNTTSGLSTLTDGLRVVRDLQKNNPEAYQTLIQTPIRFRYRSKDSLIESEGRTIEVDENGEPCQIKFSNRVDYVSHLSNAQLDNYYAAKRLFHQMINSPAYQLEFRLPVGGLMIMNNHRLLHGRTRYNSAEGNRFFQGLYIDHDSTESKYAILKELKESKEPGYGNG